MQLKFAQTRFSHKRVVAAKNILCLAVDRLNSDYLGAYGNAWIGSPAFDRLASESILFDSYYATSLDLPTLCRAFWRGESPATIQGVPGEGEDVPKSLFRILKEKGYKTYVVSDSEEVALSSAIEDDYCDGRFYLGAPDAEKPAQSIADAKFFLNFEQLAKFIAKLEDKAEQGDETPWFVWTHFSGWNKLWDFPLEARERYREDETDPAPYSGIKPPYFPSTAQNKSRKREPENALENAEDARGSDEDALEKMDPVDRRQSFSEAYSGGIATFDETLEGFLELLNERGILSKTLFALTGVRGLGTGEPSALGFAPTGVESSPFYAEETRMPLVIRLPDETGATTRMLGLCEPRDLFATLRDWPEFAQTLADPEFWKIEKIEISPFAGKWSADEDEKPQRPSEQTEPEKKPLEPDVEGQNLLTLLADETGTIRSRVVVVAKDQTSIERAVIVENWLLKESPKKTNEETEPDAPRTKLELFVLPDDRYCVNDVANRCVDVVESLSRYLR